MQTGQYSTQIFSLAVLLSSLFIYNQMGGIDEAALDRLSLVTEMTKHIRVRSEGAAGVHHILLHAASCMWHSSCSAGAWSWRRQAHLRALRRLFRCATTLACSMCLIPISALTTQPANYLSLVIQMTKAICVCSRSACRVLPSSCMLYLNKK